MSAAFALEPDGSISIGFVRSRSLRNELTVYSNATALCILQLLLPISTASAQQRPEAESGTEDASSGEHSAQAGAADQVADASAAPAVANAESAYPPPRPSLLRGDGRVVGFLATPYSGGDGSAGLGFGLGVNVGLQHIPLTIGFDVMTSYFGSNTSRVQIQAGNRALLADSTRQDLAYYLDVSLRLQPIDWWARPYLEGFVGTKLLESKYSLSFVGSGTSTDITTDHDWAGSIGWGAGVDLGPPGPLNFTLGVRRLSGARASFSRVADVGGEETVRYTVPTSNTFFMLGVTGTFGVRTADAVAASSPVQ